MPDRIQTTTNFEEQPTGLEDVIRSARALARSARGLVENTAEVAERELAMAVRIAEGVRDRVISKKALQEARKEALPAKFADSAQRLTALATDAASVLYVNAVDFVEGFADERRPPLSGASRPPAGNK